MLVVVDAVRDFGSSGCRKGCRVRWEDEDGSEKVNFSVVAV